MNAWLLAEEVFLIPRVTCLGSVVVRCQGKTNCMGRAFKSKRRVPGYKVYIQATQSALGCINVKVCFFLDMRQFIQQSPVCKL